MTIKEFGTVVLQLTMIDIFSIKPCELQEVNTVYFSATFNKLACFDNFVCLIGGWQEFRWLFLKRCLLVSEPKQHSSIE